MRIYFFIGTTAELIKLAPIIRELEERRIKFKVITSGQTDVNFTEVGGLIKKKSPDIALPKKKNRSSVFIFMIWAIKAVFATPFMLFRELTRRDGPKTFFIVHGDTVTSLIGSLVGRIFGLTIVHIEAGLRSFNFLEPFPEEITRYLVSKIADIHFCPNKWSLNNLKTIRGKKINTFQNTFVESVRAQPTQKSEAGGKYFILILHRQEHVIFQREKSKDLINFVIRNSPKQVKCIFIKHATTPEIPRLSGQVILFPRLPFGQYLALLKKAQFIVTDGGGNQEESYYLGLPCLLLRNRTERTEGLGKNVVLSKGEKGIIKDFLENYRDYKREKIKLRLSPSKIIVDYLVSNK